MLAFIIDHWSWPDLLKLLGRSYGVLHYVFNKSVLFIYIWVYSGDDSASLHWLHLKIMLFKVSYYWLIWKLDCFIRRCRWPCRLRHGSAASRLMGVRVRILPSAWISVSCECCVLSVRGLCDDLITLPMESYRLWQKPQEWGDQSPRWAAAP